MEAFPTAGTVSRGPRLCDLCWPHSPLHTIKLDGPACDTSIYQGLICYNTCVYQKERAKTDGNTIRCVLVARHSEHRQARGEQRLVGDIEGDAEAAINGCCMLPRHAGRLYARTYLPDWDNVLSSQGSTESWVESLGQRLVGNLY